MWDITIFLLFGMAIAWSSPKCPRKFPEDFIFGASTAAYQIEGGWDADGKTQNIWDYITRLPGRILDNSTGDIAADSYHLYKRDIQMLRELGVNFYRFSISWNRILPSGFPDEINAAGVKYYNDLIDELLAYNIQPIVTIVHFDHPLALQNLDGWNNADIITWFSDYARVVFQLFGDRVKYFVTINEPPNVCLISRLLLASDPIGDEDYVCAKNLLIAHATAYRIYDEEFRASQKGNILISINAEWHEPASAKFEDVVAAHDAIQFNWGLYAWPIFSTTGDFPPEVKQRVAAKSKQQGFSTSRLPEFTPEEIELIKGSFDLFGLNHYSTRYVYRNASVPTSDTPSLQDDLGVASYQSQDWQIGESNYTMYVPWGFKKLLDYIKVTYNNPPVFITENGFASYGPLLDDDRVKYYRGYLDAVLDALDNGSDIRAYTAWSLMDNFEWISGYTQHFGLYEVDFESINRTRTPRKSAYVYKEVLRTRTLDHHYEPDLSAPITIDPEH